MELGYRQYQSMELRQELGFPAQVVSFYELATLDENGLVDVLTQAHDEVRTSQTPPNEKKGNYFYVNAFQGIVRKRAQTGSNDAQFTVELNADSPKVMSNLNMERITQALSVFKRDAPVPVQRIFSKKFKDELEFSQSLKTRALEFVLTQQREAILEQNPYKFVALTQHDVADYLGIHPTGVSRIAPACSFTYNEVTFNINDFLLGESTTRLKAMAYMLRHARIHGYNALSRQLSDSEVAKDLAEDGITLARRTVTKARDEITQLDFKYNGRKPIITEPIEHWSYERPIEAEETQAIISDKLSLDDRAALFEGIYWDGAPMDGFPVDPRVKTVSSQPVSDKPKIALLNNFINLPVTTLWYQYCHFGDKFKPETLMQLTVAIENNCHRPRSLSVVDIQDLKQYNLEQRTFE